MRQVTSDSTLIFASSVFKITGFKTEMTPIGRWLRITRKELGSVVTQAIDLGGYQTIARLESTRDARSLIFNGSINMHRCEEYLLCY